VLTWALPLGTAQEDAVTASEKEKKTLEERVAALESLLKHFSRQGNDVFITKANLHLVNGLGSMDCFESDQGEEIPNCPNGLGNLIVGYNELREPPVEDGEDPNVRTGSHNVVVGQRHNFSQVGRLVVGDSNQISGRFASVSGGRQNTASGDVSSVCGGGGIAEDGETVLGNTASGDFAVVSGGQLNTASGRGSTVSGGQNRTAEGENDWVAGSLFEDD
jgi:hypothetical protein